jgi:L-amino acid N-acyltransferase YncA
MLTIRSAKPDDRDAIWAILKPIIRAGDTYTLPREIDKAAALDYRLSHEHEVFVAADSGEILGTYYLRANQKGGGSHVANCGYMTAMHAAGRGVASAMCAHSLERARVRDFRAMQFNFVVSTNERAVRLCRRTASRSSAAFPRLSCILNWVTPMPMSCTAILAKLGTCLRPHQATRLTTSAGC